MAAPPPMAGYGLAANAAERLAAGYFPGTAIAPENARYSLSSQRSASTPSLAQALRGTQNSTFSAVSSTQNVASSRAPARYSMGIGQPAMAAPTYVPATMLDGQGVRRSVSSAGPARTTYLEATDMASARDYAELARAISPHWRADNEVAAYSPQIASHLAMRSEDSPRRRKKPLRADRLYEDALARRRRQQELKDEADQNKRNNLEEGKRDAMLRQRERQRYYHFRDTATRGEREAAVLSRREKRTMSYMDEQRQKQELEKVECTFKPRFYTRPQEGARSPGRERVSSCERVATEQDRRSDNFMNQTQPMQQEEDSPCAMGLQQMLTHQQKLIQMFAEIDTETDLVRGVRKGGHQQQAEQLRETDVRLYKRNLDVVHSCDRLDMEVLELNQAQLDALLAMGYRLGLGEKGRRGLSSPREASRRALEETPRNNLRERLEVPNATTFLMEQSVKEQDMSPYEDDEHDFNEDFNEDSEQMNGGEY